MNTAINSRHPAVSTTRTTRRCLKPTGMPSHTEEALPTALGAAPTRPGPCPHRTHTHWKTIPRSAAGGRTEVPRSAAASRGHGGHGAVTAAVGGAVTRGTGRSAWASVTQRQRRRSAASAALRSPADTADFATRKYLSRRQQSVTVWFTGDPLVHWRHAGPLREPRVHSMVHRSPLGWCT